MIYLHVRVANGRELPTLVYCGGCHIWWGVLDSVKIDGRRYSIGLLEIVDRHVRAHHIDMVKLRMSSYPPRETTFVMD